MCRHFFARWRHMPFGCSWDSIRNWIFTYGAVTVNVTETVVEPFS